MNKNDIFKNLNYLKSIDLDDKLTELLIKEKQQIATAFDIADTGSYINGTDYYEQTYENK